MFADFDIPTKQIFWGNLWLVVCCGFYLAWWALAFKPVGAIKGIKSGWLLLPACVAGMAAIVLIVKGMAAAVTTVSLLPGRAILWGGIAAYILLLLVTLLAFGRPVTTELLLIVGWAMLTLAEINTLYGLGGVSRGTAWSFITITVAAFILCVICYVLYYRLDARMAYWDGMVPLFLAALIMAGLSVFIACATAKNGG